MSVIAAVQSPGLDSARRAADRAPSLFDESSDPDNQVVRCPAGRSAAAGSAALGHAALRKAVLRHAEPAAADRGFGRAGAWAATPAAVSPAVPVPQAARDLLADATRGLGRAMRAATAADRYAAAHLAALRAAAAVLAAKARPVRGRRGSAWELMAKVAPEFGEWAAFFAAGSAKRQAAEAGLHRLVTAREADDMVRQAAVFVDLVDSALAGGTAGQDRARQRRTR